MINFFRKYFVSVSLKYIVIKIIAIAFVLLLPSTSLYSKEYVARAFLDVGILEDSIGFSERISDLFDISKPFVIPASDIDKNFTPDMPFLHYFYKYKKHLNKHFEYNEIKNYSLQILREYYTKLILPNLTTNSPSGTNLFIGMGSSPTPLISFLENLKKLNRDPHYVLHDELQTYLEASEFLSVPFSKNIIPDYSFYTAKQQQKPYYQERYLRLFKLIDLYTKHVNFEGKNIIIMDFALSGVSIALFTRIFLKYLEFKNIKPRSINLQVITTLTPTGLITKLKTLENVTVDNVYWDYPILGFKLYNSNYDKVSKYPYYQRYYLVQNYSYTVRESLKYQKYSLKIKNEMKKDPDIVKESCSRLFSTN